MLVLTSSCNFVAKVFISHLPKSPQEMKLTFIPTAAEVEKGDLGWLYDDRQALVDVGFHVIDFTCTGKKKDEVEEMLRATDFVFVSGGNTFYLLQQMNKSGFSQLIKQYVEKGMLYGGSSAGSVVAGPDISVIQDLDDIHLAPELNNYAGLGLTDVVVLPHWGNKHFRQDYENLMKSEYKKGHKMILLTDDQYLLVENGKYSIESLE